MFLFRLSAFGFDDNSPPQIIHCTPDNKINYQPNRRLNHQQIVSPSTDCLYYSSTSYGLGIFLGHLTLIGLGLGTHSYPINGDVTRSTKVELFGRQ